METNTLDACLPDDEADRIYRTLKGVIGENGEASGKRIASERTLSQDLKAPRSAVRRALQRLAAEGTIERGVGRAGSRIVHPTDPVQPARTRAASPQDVLEARLAFEPELASLVVARATEDDFAAMAAELNKMEIADTQQGFREHGYAFHLELTRATRNPLLIDLFEAIIAARSRAGWGKLLALNASAEQRAAQIARNRKTLEALRQRDAALASGLLREHLRLMLYDVLNAGGL